MNSAWKIEFSPKALKQLKKIDRSASVEIVHKIEKDLARFGDPRAFGEAMIGNWTGYWRYRAGNYRAIANIQDDRVVVFGIEVAHRREVYR